MSSGELKKEVYDGRQKLKPADRNKFERMIIYLKNIDQEAECIAFKADVETVESDFVFRVYKDYNVSSCINECFSNTYHNKVKDGPRRPNPVSSHDLTGGGNSFITKPTESDNLWDPNSKIDDTLKVIRFIDGKVTLVEHNVVFNG